LLEIIYEHLLRLVESTDLSDPKIGVTKTKEENINNIINKPIKISCMFKKHLDVDINNNNRTCSIIDKPKDVLDRITPSYMHFQKRVVIEDIRLNTCRLWTEVIFDETKASLYAKEQYELPDGTIVYLGADRFKSAEMLIHPELEKSFLIDMDTNDPLANNISLPCMIRDSIQCCNVDLRKELLQSLILVGGGSILPGLVERLNKELSIILPSTLKPKFLIPSKNERLFSTFIGASILASLGSFQQLWISKNEYDEFGSAIIGQRCVQ